MDLLRVEDILKSLSPFLFNQRCVEVGCEDRAGYKAANNCLKLQKEKVRLDPRKCVWGNEP